MSETGSRRHTSSSRSSRGDEPDVVEELRQLKERAAEVVGSVRESAGTAAEQVKQKATEMSRAITGTIKEEAERLFDEQKGKAASKVTRFGKVMHQAAHALHAVKADGLADYVDETGNKIEGLTDYLEERTLAQVIQDAGEVARRHPGMVIGGMFVTGLAVARFLKASASREDEGGESADDSGEEESAGGGRSGASSRRGR
jgi:hypothetical protein